MLLRVDGTKEPVTNENRAMLQAVYGSKPAGDRHVAYTRVGSQNKRDHQVLETVLNKG